MPTSRPEIELVGTDGDDEAAPGALEDQEKFASEDAHVAQAIQLAQKAQRTQDLKTVFTEVVHEGQDSYRICQVCQ